MSESSATGRDGAEAESEVLTADDRGARWLRRHTAGSVAVVTTSRDGTFWGTTLSAWMVASVDPVKILVSLEEESQMGEWLRATGVFALNVLPWREQFLADQFAGFTPRASRVFAGIDHFIGSTGAPILANSVAWVECAIASEMEVGDHVCFVGDAMTLGRGQGNPDDPLVYFLNRYRRFR